MRTIRRARGLLYEDFEVGRRFDHHWGRTFTDHDSIWFSTMTLNLNPMFFDAEHARGLGHRGVVVNPMLVYNVVLGLSVEDLSEAGGPFLGIDDLRFGVNVYAGDTVTASSVVLDRRLSKSKPGWGIVEFHTSGRNQESVEVIGFRRRNLSRCAEPAADAGGADK